MERSRAVLIALTCVLFSRISGAEVEMRVRPGDDVTLYSDCVWKTVWFRNCSHDHQPPLIMSSAAQRNHAVIYNDLGQNPLPRYFFKWNSSSQTHDLLVKNVSESDLGLYYCALQEKKITEDKTGRGAQKDVFHYGNRTTRLSLLDTTPQTPSTPPVSDCSVCWKLLVSVCPVCVLLSSTCVCCIYRHTTKGQRTHGAEKGEKKQTKASNKEHFSEGQVEGDVCYASLDLPIRRNKCLMKKREESSAFSTYSEHQSLRWRDQELFSSLSPDLWSRSGDEGTQTQSHAVIYNDLGQNLLPRYFFKWNSSSETHDLLVKNVSESDLGLYYCAVREKKITEDKTGRGAQKDVFHYGNRTTRLSLLDTTPQTPSTPPVSDCSVCWKLLVSVCPVCVLLSSTCVCCIYKHTTTGRKKHGEVSGEKTEKQKSSKSNKVRRDDVCYASLDLPSKRQKPLKEERVENFEFSTYSEVKTDRL
ncbi:hypothetical protein SRHO_G00248260 [Serrasalmus rhombeus]